MKTGDMHPYPSLATPMLAKTAESIEIPFEGRHLWAQETMC